MVEWRAGGESPYGMMGSKIKKKKGKGSEQGGGKTVTKAARIENPVRGI